MPNPHHADDEDYAHNAVRADALPGAGPDAATPDDSGDDECVTSDVAGQGDACGACGLVTALDATELAALITRVVDRDQAALAALYDALSGRVYASALRITRQVALAEEVMQDCFWQVWRQAPRFDAQRGNAVAWVMNIARSRALDALRAAQRAHAHQQALEQQQLEDASIDPCDWLNLDQRDGRVQRTLAALDPLKRQLIALAYYRGLTQDEIAAQIGMPLGTVKSHMRRTLAALRLALERAAPADGAGRST